MNSDKYENKGKILKVIYYDENAAMDYVTIMNDGNITIEEINKAIEGKDNEIEVNGEASIKKSFLKMLNFSVGVKSDVAAHSSNEKIVNSTITTNIMTEFIKLADKDDNIEKLVDLKLDIDQDTATYLKSMFPYLSLLKNPDKFEELKDINTNKIDEVILSTKGYFEFLAYKSGVIFAILRFNIDCFKNNYKFNDLIKMNLCYYGIKVGTTTKESIKLENEINQYSRVLTEEEFDTSINRPDNKLPIYDIIIAGVRNG